MGSPQKTRLVLAITASLGASLLPMQTPSAEIRVGVQWGSCDSQSPIQHWERQRVYRQVIVGTGFTAPNTGHRFRLAIEKPYSGIARPVPDA